VRLPGFSTEPLLRFLRSRKTATLPQLLDALGSTVPMTVFRKLKELSYLTSYSHRGRFYTLDRIARFDERGLWSHDSVWFSRCGTLVSTAEEFVNRSAAGYFVPELEEELHVAVQDPLLRLVREKRLSRHSVTGAYLYCSAEPATRERQLRKRYSFLPQQVLPATLPPQSVTAEVKAGIVLFYSLLDEKQRRIYAGLEALKLGRGGDRRIASLLGLDVHTVAKGRRELSAGEEALDQERVRRPGAGRKPVEKKLRR
jgi:hypothetical protein